MKQPSRGKMISQRTFNLSCDRQTIPVFKLAEETLPPLYLFRPAGASEKRKTARRKRPRIDRSSKTRGAITALPYLKICALSLIPASFGLH